MGQQAQQQVIDLLRLLGDGPPQLQSGVAHPQGGLCVDQVHDGLGLAQVQPPVEEGPAAEFPRQGHARPLPQQGMEQLLQGGGAAVTLKLRRVLPGEAAGAEGIGAQDLVQDPALLVHGLPQHQPVGPEVPQKAALLGTENRLRQSDGPLSAEADDPQGGAASRGGNGGNGIGHSILRIMQ